MPQHAVRVTMLVDAKDAHSADQKTYRILQDACRSGELINWMFSDIQNGLAAMRVSPPIRNAHNGRFIEEKILDEYDRLLAVRALTKEQNNV